MKRLLIAALLALVACVGHAKEAFVAGLPAQPASHPSLYSFADVYRLTVGGQLAQPPAPAESPMRVAAAQPAAASAPQFSFSAVREPQRWALLAAGILLAVWVARRRMEAVL